MAATKTEAKKSRKVSVRYDLCCMSIAVFTHPGAPYRVYIADSADGKIVGRYEAAAFETEKEARQWLNQHCKYWTICDAT